MKTKKLTNEEINYNVLNALNLFAEELGNSYLNGEFNPFDYNFILTEEFVIERIENFNKEPKELNAPAFILNGIKETKTAFNNSINSCNILINKLEELLNSPTTPQEVKEKLKNLKLYLICRVQLLTIFVKKIKKDKNTFNMYSLLQGLSWDISEILNDSYKENFNVNLAVSMLINLVNQNLKSQNKQNKDLINQAKAIIKANQEKINETKTVKEPLLAEIKEVKQEQKPKQEKKQSQSQNKEKQAISKENKANNQKTQRKQKEFNINDPILMPDQSFDELLKEARVMAEMAKIKAKTTKKVKTKTKIETTTKTTKTKNNTHLEK